MGQGGVQWSIVVNWPVYNNATVPAIESELYNVRPVLK